MTLKDFNSVTLKVNGKEVVIDIEKEFSLGRKDLEKTPLILGYLTALHFKLLKNLQKARTNKDKYWGTQFSISKDPGGAIRPPSDETVKAEINSDSEYLSLLSMYHNAQANYELVSNLLDVYKVRAEILRTLSANSRKGLDSEY